MKDNPITCKEAGHRGGTKTKQRHGHEYYVAIGKKGGEKIKEAWKAYHEKMTTINAEG